MSYRIIYCPADYQRVIPAVLIDRRASIPAIAGAIGSVIKAYTDNEANFASMSGNLFYKIETAGDVDNLGSGNLAGYFTLRITGSAILRVQYELRPAYAQFDTQISQIVSNFIASGDYQFNSL